MDKVRQVCEVGGCESAVFATKLCAVHYNRKNRTGSVERIRPVNAEMRCPDGCGRPVVARGLCDTHYREVRRAELRAERIATDDRLCIRCSAPMASRNSRAMYCSRECKSLAHIENGGAAKSSREHYYRKQYGMSREQAIERFGDKCNICGRQDGGGRFGNLHIDHDHKTGAVRGVLCHGCNVSIGHFRDDPELLRAAIQYLGGMLM